MSGSSYQMLMRFADKDSDAFADQSLDEQPSNFAARAWPLLRQCLTSEQGYYLSYSELLLVCEVHRQHLAIFGTRDDSLVYLGSCIHDDRSTIRCVALQGYNGLGRVRGHYQRLLLADNFDLLQEQWAREAAEAQARRLAEQQAKRDRLQQEAQERAQKAAAEQEERQRQAEEARRARLEADARRLHESEDADMHRTQHMDQQANLQQKQAADARKAEQDRRQRADDEHRGASAARLDPLAFWSMQAMLGNTSSAASVQIGAADSEGNPDVGNHDGGTGTQGMDEGKGGDGARGSPDIAATDAIKLTVPSVQQSSSRLWVNTFNVNIREHDAEPFEHERLYHVPRSRN